MLSLVTCGGVNRFIMVTFAAVILVELFVDRHGDYGHNCSGEP